MKCLKYPAGESGKGEKVEGKDFDVNHGDVVVAAITSCTNTSNPSVMLAAGLVAKKPMKKELTLSHGLKRPWLLVPKLSLII